MTYEEIVRMWAEERESLGEVAPFTAQKSAEKARYFVPFFGDREPSEITPLDISRALQQLKAAGGKSGKGLSGTTLRAIHMAGTQALDWAVGYQIAESNPFHAVKRPKATTKEMSCLSPEDAARLAQKAEEGMRAAHVLGKVKLSSFYLAVALALATGMRRGELFALKTTDIENGRVSVSRAIKAGGDEGRPKTVSGARSIAIGDSALRLIESHAKVTGFERVICDEHGERASLNAFEHWWRDWADSNGFVGLRFHELRHTHATILIADGVDVKTVQTRLGHASADITMNVYAHAAPARDVAAADALDAALFGKEEA